MKAKLLILTLVCIVLSNCEVKPRETKAQVRSEQELPKRIVSGNNADIISAKIHTNNMDYLVLFSDPDMPDGGAAIGVINLTKDQLEVEKLREDIKFLKSRM